MSSKIMVRKFVALVALVFAFNASADVSKSNPYQLLNTVADKTFNRIKNERKSISAEPEKLKTIVSEELLPYIDYTFAAYMVLGKNLKKTTTEQRKEFVEVFKDYLVVTYAQVLGQYEDQQVQFEPEQDIKGKKVVEVKTKILGGDRPDIDISFRVRKNKKTNEWKAYDMVAEGISLLNSKRSELAPIIRSEGVESVIAMLRNKTEEPFAVKKI